MGVVNTQYTFAANDVITSTKMNDIIDQTTVTDDAILGNTLEVAGGKLKVRAQGITSNELSANAVTNTQISNGSITPAKLSTGGPSWDSAGTLTITANGTGEGGEIRLTRLDGSNNGLLIDSFNNSLSRIHTFDDASLDIGTLGTGKLQLWSGNQGRVTLASSGNLGVGTDTPSYKLHVQGGNAAIINAASDSYVYLGEGTGANEYGYVRWDSTSNLLKIGTQNNTMLFGSDSVNWMQISQNGDVGIGTLTPSVRLAVTGISEEYNGSGNEGVFQITTGSGASEDDKLQFGIVDGNYSWIQAVDPGLAVRKLILNGSGGDVGIGKTNPSSMLDVNGTVTATEFSGPLTGSCTGNAGTVTNGVYTIDDQTIGGIKSFSSVVLLADDGFRFSSDGAVDTGMSWNGDGVINVICDAAVVGQFNSSGWTGNANYATSAGSAGSATRASNGPLGGTFIQDHESNVHKMQIGGFNKFAGDNGIHFYPYAATNALPARACEFWDPSRTTVRGTLNITGTGVSLTNASDYRLKTDAIDIEGSLAKLNSLHPVNFKWLEDGSRSDGFIAHELQSVEPNAVTGEKDAIDENGKPIYQQIDQSKLIPIMVAAIQELSKKVTELESK